MQTDIFTKSTEKEIEEKLKMYIKLKHPEIKDLTLSNTLGYLMFIIKMTVD